MKKVIAIILCIVFLFSLTACGSGEDTSPDNVPASSSQTQNNDQPEENTSSDVGEDKVETADPGNTNDAIESLEKQFTGLEKMLKEIEAKEKKLSKMNK